MQYPDRKSDIINPTEETTLHCVSVMLHRFQAPVKLLPYRQRTTLPNCTRIVNPSVTPFPCVPTEAQKRTHEHPM